MKKDRADRYDVIVVGAGIAGLSCVNYLARGGKRVLLLEQNHQSGGCMSGFWRKGFYFDGGDQSFESAGIVLPLLSELGVYAEHEWHRADYRVKSADFDFRVTSTADTRERMLEAFAGDPGVKAFFDEAEKLSRFFSENCDPWHLRPLEDPNPRNVLAALKWLPDLRRWADPGFKEKLCAGIRREDVRHWFLNSGYYKMPFFLFGGFWHLWAHDYWYPAGGIQSLNDSLVKKFEALGGEARFKTPVERILVRDGRAEGVLTGKGERILSGQVVYAGDYQRLVENVLGEEYFRPAFVDKIRRSRRTEAMLDVFLGLDLPAEELKKHMRAHHVLFWPDLKVTIPGPDSPRDAHRNAWMELSSPSLESPRLAPPGKSSLVIQTFANIRWQNYWQNGSERGERTPEYREFKKAVGMELVKGAEAVIPGLSERIEYMDVGTPLSAVRFTMNSQGASAGWTYHLPELYVGSRFGFVSFQSPVEGLYTIGQYSFWPGGIPNSALSGKIVANSILGNFPEKQFHAAADLTRRLRKLLSSQVPGGRLPR